MKTRVILVATIASFVGTHPVPAQSESKPPLPAIIKSDTTVGIRLAGMQAMVLSTNPVAKPRPLTPWAVDVAKLARAGVSDEIAFSFIDNAGTFNLDAEQIIRLREMDVPSQWVVAMIQHDADVISGARPLTISTSPTTHTTIQFVLAPSAESAKDKAPPTQAAPAPASASGSTAPGSNESVTGAESPNEDDEIDALLLRTLRESQEKGKAYRVRQPYSEPVTPPILVFRAAGVSPNTVWVEFSR